ncbi:hypothetical protein DFH06DRAFT_1190563 [Mycena polygramma]|nr:hypothetical protein DFH06DRAFT_1190563 [Mycena polygramma]
MSFLWPFVLILPLGPMTLISADSLPLSGSNLDSNITLFTPEDSGLPAETYIATGLSGVAQLADYLDSHSNRTMRNLLISDSTIQDVDTRHGFLRAVAVDG